MQEKRPARHRLAPTERAAAHDPYEAASRAGALAVLLDAADTDDIATSVTALDAARRALIRNDGRPLLGHHEAGALDPAIERLRVRYVAMGNDPGLAAVLKVSEQLRATLEALPAARPSAIAVPLVAPASWPWRCAVPWQLTIEASPGAGDHQTVVLRPTSGKVRADSQVAFSLGCIAARTLLMEELVRHPTLCAQVSATALSGVFLGSVEAVDGASLGLAAALSAYAAMVGLQVPGEVGATGEVTLHGEVRAIDGLDSKREALARAGLTRLLTLLPSSSESAASDSACRVESVSSVRAAVDAVWPGRNTAALVDARWRGQLPLKPATVERPWVGSDEFLMVLGMVQFTDPVGSDRQWRGQANGQESVEAGCILALHGECRPQMIASIYTANLQTNYEETVRQLERQYVWRPGDDASSPMLGLRIDPHELEDVTHPQQVMEVLREKVRLAIDEGNRRANAAGRPLRVLLNVSGGTPQMEYALMRLSLRFPEVRWSRLQVRPSARLRPGDPRDRRVRVVEMPVE